MREHESVLLISTSVCLWSSVQPPQSSSRVVPTNHLHHNLLNNRDTMLLTNQDLLLLQRLLDWVGRFEDIVEFLELKTELVEVQLKKMQKLTVLFLVSGNHT
jgi:hypothetical protein